MRFICFDLVASMIKPVRSALGAPGTISLYRIAPALTRGSTPTVLMLYFAIFAPGSVAHPAKNRMTPASNTKLLIKSFLPNWSVDQLPRDILRHFAEIFRI